MKKFSVIITHYKQMDFIKEALISVLNQDYKNIEVIVADDGSPNFDKKKVDRIIKKYNKMHFEYKILDFKENEGTVKNLNRALKYVTGDFILFFAADDKLYNNKVISNFVDAFEDNDINIVTTQCLLYDKDLKRVFGKYVNSLSALSLNKKTNIKMYAKMAAGCFFGSGGTAYRKSIFEKYGLFDERYLFVEDWSYWLKVLREGEKIIYFNFKTLCHRDGGISHSEYDEFSIPPHVRQYYTDILNIYKNEIFPYFDMFSFFEKFRILLQYQTTTLYYSTFVPELLKYLDILYELKRQNKKISLLWKITLPFRNINNFIIKRIRILIRFNKIVTFSFLLWLITSVLFTILYKNNNLNIYALFYFITYFIIYIIVNGAYNTVKFLKNKKTGGLNV